MFAKKKSFEPWSIDSGIMQSLSCYLKSEHLVQGRFSRNDLKSVLDCEKRLKDNFIESFMNSLKPFVKQDNILIVNPLLAPCLSLTGAHKRDLLRRTLTQSDQLSSCQILIPLFIKSCHRELLVLIPSEKLALYFNSLLSFSNPIFSSYINKFTIDILLKQKNLN